jgi:hypothetical protein
MSSRAENGTKATKNPIAKVLRGICITWVRQIERTYDVARLRETIREALTTPERGPKVIVASSECMLNKQRREKPLSAEAIRAGRRVAAPRFGVDEEICTGDHACIRLSGCPSLGLKRLDDPLRDDPVAAVLCPSFYRAETIHNPGRLERQGPPSELRGLVMQNPPLSGLIRLAILAAGGQGGFVTSDRTVLIPSTHRALAMSEKMVPGDGIADGAAVLAAAEVAADFEALALRNSSVISAALFGALAGSGALPFPSAAFEAAIRARGKGVEASLRAFAAAHEAAKGGAEPAPPLARDPVAKGPARLLAGWQVLEAGAMAYDDLIHVAAAKTKPDRLDREMRLQAGQILPVTEYFHPRGAKILGLLPARLGRRRGSTAGSPRSGGCGRMGSWRRKTLRHAEEMAHLDSWRAVSLAQKPDLAVELIRLFRHRCPVPVEARPRSGGEPCHRRAARCGGVMPQAARGGLEG